MNRVDWNLDKSKEKAEVSNVASSTETIYRCHHDPYAPPVLITDELLKHHQFQFYPNVESWGDWIKRIWNKLKFWFKRWCEVPK